jgi:polyphosphate kinase
MIALIEREAVQRETGLPARIIAKMNALVDPQIIAALYRASQAGVQIDLIVRGICCLRPRVKGVSDRITVRSIVDRFLEHSRIFYFENACQPEVFAGSADWMPRNFFRRIEVVFPVEDGNLRERIRGELLEIILPGQREGALFAARRLLHAAPPPPRRRAAHAASPNLFNWPKPPRPPGRRRPEPRKFRVSSWRPAPSPAGTPPR